MGNVYADPSLAIIRTNDLELIKSLIYHPDIVHILAHCKPGISIDDILKDPNKQHYVFYCNNVPIGIVSFLDFTHLENKPNTYFVDIGIIKAYRGKIALDLSRKLLDIFHLQNEVFRLLCVVKINHSGCVCFCKKLGFKIIERDDDYFLLEVEHERRT